MACQLQFFSSRSRLSLIGDYTLNILNSEGLATLQGLGLQQAQIAIETDKGNLLQIVNASRLADRKMRVGLTVYGTPPLFTARLVADHFKYGRPLVSPKGERFVLHQQQGLTIALAEHPFSLLHALPELAATPWCQFPASKERSVQHRDGWSLSKCFADI